MRAARLPITFCLGWAEGLQRDLKNYSKVGLTGWIYLHMFKFTVDKWGRDLQCRYVVGWGENVPGNGKTEEEFRLLLKETSSRRSRLTARIKYQETKVIALVVQLEIKVAALAIREEIKVNKVTDRTMYQEIRWLTWSKCTLWDQGDWSSNIHGDQGQCSRRITGDPSDCLDNVPGDQMIALVVNVQLYT